MLGTSLYGRTADSTVTLVGYGIEPQAQSLYQVIAGRDLAPGDTAGILLSAPAARLLRCRRGRHRHPRRPARPAGGHGRGRDGGWPCGAWCAGCTMPGVRRSVGTVLPVMQRLSRLAAEDRASIIMVKARQDGEVPALAARLRTESPADRGQ